MSAVERLLRIMARLRDPEGGCPWDLEQDFASIAPYTLEEAYEVDDAIRRGDMAGLRDELGDLLLQVVFHARMAEEAGHFRFEDVVEGLCEKLVRRHPHVFGDARVAGSEEQTERWEAIKAAEREAAGRPSDPLDDVPLALPALARAAKLQRRAAKLQRRAAKLGPEAARAGEQEVALPEAPDEKLDGEGLGERLFALVALANREGLDAEQALREANERFAARLRGAR